MSQYIKYPADGLNPSGAVVGPGSSTDKAIARFDGTTGKLLQNSGIIVTDGAADGSTPSYVPTGASLVLSQAVDDNGIVLRAEGSQSTVESAISNWGGNGFDAFFLGTITNTPMVLYANNINNTVITGEGGHYLYGTTGTSGAPAESGSVLTVQVDPNVDSQTHLYKGINALGGLVFSVDIDGAMTAASLNVSDAVTAKSVTNPEFNAGSSGATKTIDFSNGALQKLAMTANCTFTFSNPTAGTVYCLKLTQTSAGGYTYTWPAEVLWPGGTGPTGSATGKVDIITLLYDGTNYYGTFGLNY